MRPILALLAVAACFSADMEQFTLTDGRVLVGTYDRGSQKLTVVIGKGSSTIDVPEDKIIKREQALPIAAKGDVMPPRGKAARSSRPMNTLEETGNAVIEARLAVAEAQVFLQKAEEAHADAVYVATREAINDIIGRARLGQIPAALLNPITVDEILRTARNVQEVNGDSQCAREINEALFSLAELAKAPKANDLLLSDTTRRILPALSSTENKAAAKRYGRLVLELPGGASVCQRIDSERRDQGVGTRQEQERRKEAMDRLLSDREAAWRAWRAAHPARQE